VIADDIVVIGRGRVVARGTKTDLLATAGAIVRASAVDHLTGALTAAGVTFSRDSTANGSNTLRVDADPELVGRVAHRAGVALMELRAADGAGLEDIFLKLTAHTQRERAAA
jgi:ABC-2 type transport system ATP-binding protein